MRHLQRRRVSIWAAAFLLTLATLARSAAGATGELWKTLPESPSLPNAVTSGYAPVNDIRMFYAVFGDGPPILLLHGGLANSNYWGYVVPILARRHFKVIVADSRGHGRSTRSAQPYSYDLMASDVLALMDYLNLRQVDLVGWSDGGIIGLDIAMHHPERLRRLFAYGSNSDPSGLRSDVDTSPTFTAYVERTRREYRELSPTPGQYESFLTQIREMWAQQPNFQPVQLHRITTRIAIADGAHDEGITREHTEYLARTIPGAKLIILQDVSHFGMLQNPAEFGNAVLTFLTER